MLALSTAYTLAAPALIASVLNTPVPQPKSKTTLSLHVSIMAFAYDSILTESLSMSLWIEDLL